MSTIKSDLMTMLKSLPDDATWEDVQYAIYVRQKIERARGDVSEGRTCSSDDARQRMAKWTDLSGGPMPH